jgi:hypothetical protein
VVNPTLTLPLLKGGVKGRFFTLRFIIGKDKADKEGKWTRKKNQEKLKPMKI